MRMTYSRSSPRRRWSCSTRAVPVSTLVGARGGILEQLYRDLLRDSLVAQGAAEPVELSADQQQALRGGFGYLPAPTANDAIVPTYSQVRDEIITAVRADHLDVLGFFEGSSLDPPHNDWLRSLSGFGPDVFEDVWSWVDGLLEAYAARTLRSLIAGKRPCGGGSCYLNEGAPPDALRLEQAQAS